MDNASASLSDSILMEKTQNCFKMGYILASKKISALLQRFGRNSYGNHAELELTTREAISIINTTFSSFFQDFTYL